MQAQDPHAPQQLNNKETYNQRKAAESDQADARRASTPLSTVGSTNPQDKYAQPAPEAHPR